MNNSMKLELELNRITMNSATDYDTISDILLEILKNVQNHEDLILLYAASKFLNKEK